MNDDRDRSALTDHTDHGSRLERLEEALAAGREPNADERASLADCEPCVHEGHRLIDVAARLRSAAAVLDLEPELSSAVRDRVRTAAFGGSPAPVADRPAAPAVRERDSGRRSWSLANLFGRFALAGGGAIAGALVVAIALTLGTPTAPVAASFGLSGTDLAPGAIGVAELRPSGGGSVAMQLRIRDLPPSKPGEFYELWWVGPQKRHVSCGTFRSDGSPVDLPFTSGVDVTTTVFMEVTLEKDDGDADPGPHVAQ